MEGLQSLALGGPALTDRGIDQIEDMPFAELKLDAPAVTAERLLELKRKRPGLIVVP
jgi:hypothetical protein